VSSRALVEFTDNVLFPLWTRSKLTPIEGRLVTVTQL
jgi:hypothetical protein